MAIPVAILSPIILPASIGRACGQPDSWSIASAFDMAANGLLSPAFPHNPPGSPATIPPSVLKAVGWVESGWRQYTAVGGPLVSFDFGYGIMQVTSGMAGAFGNPVGDIDPETQSQIASNYTYNIAFGASILASKWVATPPVGDRDPTAVENWYYALWAYNGWGWVNNPNNPRFTRAGTPATDPSAYPYQERVLYLVAHPPRDDSGNFLWPPVQVTLPKRKTIARAPAALRLQVTHRQPPPPLSAVYEPRPLVPLAPATSETVSVALRNTGTVAWASTGEAAVSLVYHVLNSAAAHSGAITPFSPGVLAFGQGAVAFSHPVLPGHWYTVHESIVAPSTPGAYSIEWDLEQAGGVLYSASGVPVRVEPLQVLGPHATVTPNPTVAPESAPLESLRYVADIAAPDGTSLGAGQPFVKGWLVYNDGRTPWGSRWTLRLVRGLAFGVRAVPIPRTAPCRSAEILVSMHAPRHAGRFRDVWKLVDPAGHRVGEILTVAIVVGSGSPATPIPATPTASPTATVPGPTPTATPVG
ncbi:MAG: NBR1-Ig-like domain-containing protein [Chloroflexota bacterium]|nr:NBR1-Ig-like domain-containing protein [Chloroflexota bacterium]